MCAASPARQPASSRRATPATPFTRSGGASMSTKAGLIRTLQGRPALQGKGRGCAVSQQRDQMACPSMHSSDNFSFSGDTTKIHSTSEVVVTP